MFWRIIRDSTKLGFKAGTVLGGLYFPLLWLQDLVLVLIRTGHLPYYSGSPVPFVLLALLAGSLFGTLLGALNGLFLAVHTARKPPNYLSQNWRQLAAACATLNLCGLTSLMFLMLLTNLFTDFNFSAHRHPFPKWVTDLYPDWPSFFELIGVPALAAAGAAVWAMAQMAKWCRETEPLNTDAPTLAEEF